MANLPILFCVDNDAAVLDTLVADLKQHYQTDYSVLGYSSAAEAVEGLTGIKSRGETVALFIADQAMPGTDCVDFLKKAKTFFPAAKRMMLSSFEDKAGAIQAINTIGIDYYLITPWAPADFHLYPVVDDLLGDWKATYIPVFRGIRIIGYQYAPMSHEIKNFLASNVIPYQWLDITEGGEAAQLLSLSGFGQGDLPVVIYQDGSAMAKPAISAIAAKMGLNTTHARYQMYDVVVLGAGPAGMAAAVYGASEGLKTLMIERWGPGGQAGTSSRIENYLGFPNGLSGEELTRRAMTQARRLGMEFMCPALVVGIEEVDGYKKVKLENGEEIFSRTIIITTGMQYKQIDVKGIDKFTGAGVYYGAAMTEAAACKDGDVYIVGGGNSAGQSAMYLSRFAKKVHIVIRKPDLASTMSAYLIEEIKGVPNISVLPNREVTAVSGSDRIEQIEIAGVDGKNSEKREACALFIYIGAKPFTDWLPEVILKDDKGFVITGRNLEKCAEYAQLWKLKRDPYVLETSVPGIFAAGDVRAGAMNRVASAVGEGSTAISFVHSFLAEMK